MMKNNRIISLQGLRGLACLFVFLSHCYGNLKIQNECILSIFSDLGRVGVCIFICLSGILAGGVDDKCADVSLKNSFQYMISKVKRLYSVYILAEILMFVVSFNSYVVPEWDANKLNLIIRVLAHIFMLQAFIPKLGVSYSFNGPTWYLSVFLLIWFLTPYLKLWADKIKNKRQYAVACACVMLIQLIYLGTIYSLGLKEQRYFMYVFPGINLLIYTESLFAGTWARKYRKLSSSIGSIYYQIAISAIVVMFYAVKNVIPIDFRVAFWEIPVILLIIALCYSDLRGILCSKVLVFIGNISIYIFIFHYFFIHMFGAIGIMNIQYVGVLCSFVFSVMSSYGIVKIREVCHEKNLHDCTRSNG